MPHYLNIRRIAVQRNQFFCYDVQGNESVLDYQRHVTDCVEDIVFDSLASRIELGLKLTFDVWAVWLVNLRKSGYSVDYYSAVHVDDKWITRGTGSPPCILLKNSPVNVSGEERDSFHYGMPESSMGQVGDIETTSSYWSDVGKFWRFYVATLE